MSRGVAIGLCVAALAAALIATVYVLRPANGPFEGTAVVVDVRSHSGAVGMGPDGQIGDAPPTVTLTMRYDCGGFRGEGDHTVEPPDAPHPVGDRARVRCLRSGAGFTTDGEVAYRGVIDWDAQRD